MPDQEYLTYNEIIAAVEAVARFHGQSYIFEEKKSKQLNRPYQIWEDYSEHLQESISGADWRVTGAKAVIDYLKVYSKYKNLSNFAKCVETIITKLYENVLTVMKPSLKYRNVVVHRDIWTNNLLVKTQTDGKVHAVIVDYQTVLYCPGMLDLSSLMYFNTTKNFRANYLKNILDYYYNFLNKELHNEGIDISVVYYDKSAMLDSYEESVMFGLTQACLVVPMVAMDRGKREQFFNNPETSAKVNTVSRSEEFIETARENTNYESRVTELFDEIVERYLLNN